MRQTSEAVWSPWRQQVSASSPTQVGLPVPEGKERNWGRRGHKQVCFSSCHLGSASPLLPLTRGFPGAVSRYLRADIGFSLLPVPLPFPCLTHLLTFCLRLSSCCFSGPVIISSISCSCASSAPVACIDARMASTRWDFSSKRLAWDKSPEHSKCGLTTTGPMLKNLSSSINQTGSQAMGQFSGLNLT